jgi:hypothetical protein
MEGHLLLQTNRQEEEYSLSSKQDSSSIIHFKLILQTTFAYVRAKLVRDNSLFENRQLLQDILPAEPATKIPVSYTRNDESGSLFFKLI